MYNLKMKGNLAITIFEDQSLVELFKWCNEYMPCEKRSIGHHKSASRQHWHIHMYNVELPEVKDIRKYYNRKGFKEYVIYPKNLKLSVYAEEDGKLDYYECLGYPLKEYENIDSVLYREHFINIDDEELEKLRAYAHTRWIAHKHNKEREQEREEQKATKQSLLDEHMHHRFWDLFCQKEGNECGCLNSEAYDDDGKLDMMNIYTTMFEVVLEFHDKEGKLSWRWSDIRNHVYSFLYRTKMIKPLFIIKFAERLK